MTVFLCGRKAKRGGHCLSGDSLLHAQGQGRGHPREGVAGGQSPVSGEAVGSGQRGHWASCALGPRPPAPPGQGACVSVQVWETGSSHLLFLTCLGSGEAQRGARCGTQGRVGSEKPRPGPGGQEAAVCSAPCHGLAATLPPRAQTPAATDWPFLGDRGLQWPGDGQDGLWGQQEPTRAKAMKATGWRAVAVRSRGCQAGAAPTEWAGDRGPWPQQGSEAALSVTGSHGPGPTHRQLWDKPTHGRCLPHPVWATPSCGQGSPATRSSGRPAFDPCGGGCTREERRAERGQAQECRGAPTRGPGNLHHGAPHQGALGGGGGWRHSHETWLLPNSCYHSKAPGHTGPRDRVTGLGLGHPGGQRGTGHRP